MTGICTSEVDLANMALDCLGQKPISSISPPNSNLSALVARWYPITRQEFLRSYTVWNFAKIERQVTIAYTTTVTGPTNPAAITGVSQALEGVVTAPGHGFPNCQQISIINVIGMTQLNNLLYTVNVIDANTFTLNYNGSILNTVGFTAYISGGVATPSNVVPLRQDLVSDFSNFYTMPNDCLMLLSVGGSSETLQYNPFMFDLREGFLCTRSGCTPTDNGGFGPDNWQNLQDPGSTPVPLSLNIRYIQDVPDLSKWAPDARVTLAYELAVALAFPITKDPKMVAYAESLLEKHLAKSISKDGQEKPPLRIQRSPTLEARMSAGVYRDARFYFPRDYGY